MIQEISIKGIKHIVLDTTSSTMDITAQMLTNVKKGEWVLVTAEEQTRSQGPKGKSWLSPYGLNIYMSLLIAIDSSLCSNHMFDLNFEQVVGLCVNQTVSAMTDNRCISQVKWINDVLINGKKVSGTYCIRHHIDQSQTVLEVGIGLNVNMESHFFNQVDQPITSLKYECDLEIDRNVLLECLLNSLRKNLNTFFDKGFQPFHQDINQNLAFIGQTLTFDLNANHDSLITPEHYNHPSLPPKLIQAEIIGLDTNGKLIINPSNQLQQMLVDARVKICKVPSSQLEGALEN